MVTKKKKFDWKILGKKVGLAILGIVIAGGVSVYANNVYWLMILPVLVGLQNWLKHR